MFSGFHRLVWCLGGALLGVVLWAAPARALGPCPAKPADTKQARRLATKWWQAGIRLYEIGSYAEAIRTWKCAYRLAPHPLALINIAKAAERAGQYRVALDHYRRYLRAKHGARVRAKVREAIERMKAKIRSQPRRPLPTGPGPGGARRPEAPAPKSGKMSAVAITGWTLVGVTGALAVLASTFGALAVRARRTVEDAAEGTPWAPTLAEAATDYRRFRIATWTSLGVGLTTLAVGAALLILDRRSRGRGSDQEVHTPGLSVGVAPGGVTLGYGGRF